ncbi:hypothetical protein [Roseimicrobium sp. ORNL1]|uniref:hypothetical protein n=1 Tax=Roseimicrobium sp. ORNL1 TaxID=2711231 RepID=UPI0013E10702|nr:hypothetical protein [Roseimicrobium sp. ORNL1]QIF02845.1 hypothetical protein G5S37_15390 [Roseimicrobium sp. ORNL1]
MKTVLTTLIFLIMPIWGGAQQLPNFMEHIYKVTPVVKATPAKLPKNGSITTNESFKPPVEIIIEAKTNDKNLRIGYAADQVIFNWEQNQSQLRVDGGPAHNQHKPGVGLIPKDQFVTIRWVVLHDRQQIYVNGTLRYEHQGDYSKVNRPVNVFSAQGSYVTVKSIRVRQLPPTPSPANAVKNGSAS